MNLVALAFIDGSQGALEPLLHCYNDFPGFIAVLFEAFERSKESS